MLEIQTYETVNLSILDPELLQEMDSAIFSTEEWDVLTPSAQRIRIDDGFFDALRLTVGERGAVYEGVTELVGNRIQKAGNV